MGDHNIRPLDGDKASRITRYRERAEELRAIAEDLKRYSERETLYAIATTYEEMADEVALMTAIEP